MKFTYRYLVFLLLMHIAILSGSEKNNKNFKLGILSSWNVKCGIATYTKNIVEALREKNIFPKIYGSKFKTNKLIAKIKKDAITVLNIQYRGGLYENFDDLVNLIYQLKRNNIKIVLTVHCFDHSLYRILKLVDTVILHKNITGPKIKNVHLIPMGTPAYNPALSKSAARLKYGFAEDDKIIVTNGFMFSVKQHANILKEIAPYLKQSPKFKVQLLTAFHETSADQCRHEYANIQRVIHEYGIADQVIHITEFMPQLELSERIWLSDVGYIWMDSNTDETSAAAKEFIAARVPIVLCNSSHFHDLHKGVARVSFNKPLFARTIFNLLESDNLLKLKSEIEELYEERNYKNLIVKFINAYTD